MRRRSVLLVAALLLVAVVAIGATQLGAPDEPSSYRAPTAGQLRERLAGAPAPLARLHERGNALLAADTVQTELTALKGYPVVVNKWASWCGPCKAEFPTFQEVSAELGKEVGFLGLNAGDGPEPATRFLEKFPTSFPSISDPGLEASAKLKVAGTYFPTTIFYDARGKQTYIHQGPYLEADVLRADIAKYTRG